MEGRFIMYQLLDKDRATLLQLLSHFYTLEKNYSYSEYAEFLGCDRRKIVKLVKLFKLDVDSNHWENMITIHATEKEVDVIIGNNFSLDFFYSHYMQQSIGFILCWEIFNNRFTTIQQFSNDVYMSRSSVYKRIQSLKTILYRYNLNLDFSNPRIILGDEHQIRYFFYHLFSEAFQTNEWPFDSLNIDFISTFSLSSQEIHPYISTPALIKFRLMIAIYLIRSQCNYWIDYINPHFHLTNILIDFSNFKSVMQTFFKENKYFDEELSFLYFFLTTLDSIELKYFETIDTMKLESISHYLELSKKWIHLFCAFFDVFLQPKQYFFLLTNLTYLHHQIHTLKGHSTTMDHSMFASNPSISQTLHFRSLSDFYKSLKTEDIFSQLFKLNSSLDLSYTLLTRDIIKTIYPPLNVLIYSKINSEQQNWLAELICTSVQIPIKKVAYLSEKPDIIISDFPVHSFIKNKTPLTYFLCHSFPTKNELEQLNELAERLYFRKEISTFIEVPNF